MAIDVTGRTIVLADLYLVESFSAGCALRAQVPEERGKVLAFLKSWEGSEAQWGSVFTDTENFLLPNMNHRLYWRAAHKGENTGIGLSRLEYFESRNGILWKRPEVGYYTEDLSSNVIWSDIQEGTQNFDYSFASYIFKDTKPGVPSNEKYKLITGGSGPRYLLSSNGINWNRTAGDPRLYDSTHWPGYDPEDENPITDLRFDSQTTLRWDHTRNRYISYARSGNQAYRWSAYGFGNADGSFTGEWGDFNHIEFNPLYRLENLYDNRVIQCPSDNTLLYGLWNRFSGTPGSNYATTEVGRRVYADLQEGGADCIITTSRDGITFDNNFPGPWIGPPRGDDRSRGHQNGMLCHGIIETKYNEWSVYAMRRRFLHDCQLQRYSFRKEGLAGIEGGYRTGGEGELPYWISKEIVITEGNKIYLNVNTGTQGAFAVEILDSSNVPIAGYTLENATTDTYYQDGDHIRIAASWGGNENISPLWGQNIKLKVYLEEAKHFALEFGD